MGLGGEHWFGRVSLTGVKGGYSWVVWGAVRFRAWRWLVRDNVKEKRYSDAYEKDRANAIDMEDEFDMAYRAIVPAPLERAIMKINKDEDAYSDDAEHATILETDGATHKIEKRTNKLKKQKPVITVVMILALGLRKMRAELRRRVIAWTELMVLAADDSGQEEVATPTRNRK